MHYRTAKTASIYNPAAARRRALAGQMFSMPSLVLLDGLAVTISFFLAFYFRDFFLRGLFPSLFPEELLAGTFENIWWFPLVLIFSLFYEELYQKRLPFWIEVEHILKATTLAIAFTVVILFMSKTAFEVSRTLIATIWFMLVITLPLFRYYGKQLLAAAGIWNRPVLIIGAGKTACLITDAFHREKSLGYKAIGFLNDRGENAETVNSSSACHIPILGDITEAESIIKKTGVQDIFVAMPALPPQKTVKLVNRLQPLVNNVVLIPDLFGLSMSGIEAKHFFEEQVLMLNIKNRLKPFFNRAVKRTFDLVLGSIFLLISTPLMLLIALVIKLESRGSVFYNSKRIGQQGKTFRCHKFRSMYTHADEILAEYLASSSQAQQEWEQYRKLKSADPRLTKAGKFLRRFSLDELPQLINVVIGEMSLVGPRPYLPDEKELMGDWYDDITVAKPGLTGLWQVSGRNLIGFEGRMKLGAWYVKNWSLWLDIVIMLRTLRVVLKGEGAY